MGADRTAFVDVCTTLGFKWHVLKYRATENHFTEDAIKKVKGDKYKALEPYELLKEADLPWGKGDNWKIAQEMDEQDLEEGLLEFLTELCK